MRFSADKKELEKAVAWVSQALPARPADPVLGGVRFVIGSGHVELNAYDSSVGARVQLEVKDAEPGELIMPGALIKHALSKMGSTRVDLELDEGGSRAQLTGGGAGYQLLTIPAGSYPSLPEPSPSNGRVATRLFRDAVAQVRYATGEANESIGLRNDGVYLEVAGNELTLVATDMFRIPVARCVWEPAVEAAQMSVILPHAALTVAASMAGEFVELSFPAGRGVMGFRGEGRTLTTGVYDGKFPNWRNALSRVGSQLVAEVEAAELKAALDRATVVLEENTPVRLSFSQDGLQVEAGSHSTMAEVIAAEVKGEPMACTYNLGYLMKALEVSPTPHVRMHINAKAPCMIFSMEKDKPSYQQLLSIQRDQRDQQAEAA